MLFRQLVLISLLSRSKLGFVEFVLFAGLLAKVPRIVYVFFPGISNTLDLSLFRVGFVLVVIPKAYALEATTRVESFAVEAFTVEAAIGHLRLFVD